jgi:trehalose synthase-fused probable maltokinase
LGEVIARLHGALGAVHDVSWHPEPIVRHDLQQWRDTMMQRLHRAAPALAHDAQVQRAVEQLAPTIMDVSEPGKKSRIHGDLHLGQVLQTSGGWVVFDFEGEPLRPLSQRTAKTSPLRDVAGMLRSYDYAAFAVLFQLAAPASATWERLAPLALRWEEAMREAFLQGWRNHAPAWAHSPGMLLDWWELDKAVYELGYELEHRPDWLRIPMHGIHRIISRKRE